MFKDSDPPVSLFSFQDIVTTLIGIMILFVLLLSLELMETTQTFERNSPVMEELKQLRERRRSLEARSEEMSRRLETLANELDAVGEMSEAEMRYESGRLRQRIATARATVAEVDRRLLQAREAPADEKLAAALAWRYPYADAAEAPLKLTITGLVREIEGPAVRQELVERPAFLSEGQPSAAQRGTDVHRLLARVKQRRRILAGARLGLLLQRGGLLRRQTDGVMRVEQRDARAERQRAAGEGPERRADAHRRLDRIVPCAHEEHVVPAGIHDGHRQRAPARLSGQQAGRPILDKE